MSRELEVRTFTAPPAGFRFGRNVVVGNKLRVHLVDETVHPRRGICGLPVDTVEDTAVGRSCPVCKRLPR